MSFNRMEELTIKVKIKNEVLPIPEAIDFLGSTLEQINYKQKPDEFLFNWDEIIKNDSEKLINVLKEKYFIDWIKEAKIKKTYDGKNIRVSFATNYVSLILNNDKTKVNLAIDDGRTDEFIVKMEKDKLQIYFGETRSEKQILIDYYTAHPIELRRPNQLLYLIFKKIPSFDLDEKEYESLIEHIIYDEIELECEILKIKHKKKGEFKEYLVGLNVEGRLKRDNLNKCKPINEIILIRGFHTETNYGRVSSANISYSDLAFIPKKLNCRIINTIMRENNVTYISFSEIIYNKLTEMLKNKEYDTLPQIDFSDYVNELKRIIRTHLFKRNCSDEYPLDINQELENFKKGIYGDKLWIAIEHILRNISERNGCSGNSLGKYLAFLSSDDSNRRLFDETKYLIMALDRNKLAHGKLAHSNYDQKYLTILCMKALRDVYLNWCFFQSLDKCFTEMEKYHLNTSSEEFWKIYNGNKHGNEQYCFSWDEIPGNESKKLIGFLKTNYGIDWIKTAEIKKFDDGMTIRASFEINNVLLILAQSNFPVIFDFL